MEKTYELVVKRKYVPLMTDFFLSAYADKDRWVDLYGFPSHTQCMYASGNYFYGKGAYEFGLELYDRALANHEYLDKVFDKIYRLGNETDDFAKKISNECKNKETDELINEFKQFADRYLTFALSLAGFYLQFPVEKRLSEILVREGVPQDDLGLLVFPVKENFASLELIDLYKIGAEVIKNGTDNYDELSIEVKKLIKKHAEEYGWINSRGGLDEPWSSGNIFKRIKDQKIDFAGELEKLEENRNESIKESEKLASRLNLTKEEEWLVDVARELVYFRTYRTDYLNMIMSHAKQFMKELALQKGMTFEDILHLRIQEITQGINVNQSELEARKKDYVFITDRSGETFFSSKPEDIRKCVEERVKDVESDGSIRGAVAYKGVIKGTARVVQAKSEMSKVNEGDVLVMSMTTPDYVPVMKKAGAFVTDEGGITCHAAIVARELKKPCIIGTKVATQVLKDGMEVEVDADNGVVRIL